MAQWDGAKALAPVMASKGLGKYMNFDAVLAGSLPAVSLKLYVIDGHERELLVGSGGIHLTQRIGKGRIVEVPEAELFTDPEKDQNAVKAATGGFRPKGKSPVQKQK
jgi:hypothetical protein